MRLIMMPDSVAHLRALFLSRTCVADEAPQALAEASGSHVGVVEYTTGIRPEERPLLPGYDDGVTALVTGIFVLLSISVSRHTFSRPLPRRSFRDGAAAIHSTTILSTRPASPPHSFSYAVCVKEYSFISAPCWVVFRGLHLELSPLHRALLFCCWPSRLRPIV